MAKPHPARPQNRPQVSPKTEGGPNITKQIMDTIQSLSSLKDYPIRELVEHSSNFGPHLRQNRLDTNQIRKFLDAVKQIKAALPQSQSFAAIETDIVLLKPKLAYATARQSAAKPLSDVMAIAIDKTHSEDDFERLVQLLESIIAYHKASGGK